MRSRRHHDTRFKLDFDVNIVPIIDCLTILVTFMLASGAFLSIGVLDVGLNAAGKELSDSKKPEIQLTLEVKDAQRMVLNISGKESSKLEFPSKDGKLDGDALHAQLEQLKAKYPEVAAVTVLSGQEVVYAEVVTAMDSVKKTHDQVQLGGF